MSAIIILAIALPIIALYNSVAKSAAYKRMIKTLSPSWNISIELS